MMRFSRDVTTRMIALRYRSLSDTISPTSETILTKCNMKNSRKIRIGPMVETHYQRFSSSLWATVLRRLR